MVRFQLFHFIAFEVHRRIKLFLLREFLTNPGVWRLIILGAIFFRVILVEPKGIWGLLRRAI